MWCEGCVCVRSVCGVRGVCVCEEYVCVRSVCGVRGVCL